MSTQPINPDKDMYKIRNWKEYNSSLRKRGSLTLFLEESVLKEWEQLTNKKKAVGEQSYCKSIIRCCLLIKLNYRLKLRQSTGFLTSLFFLMGKSYLPIPDYTTLCRRQKNLPVEISQRLDRGEKLIVGVDSTGLKVFGEGEWKVRKHGYTKHRTWRKLHICVDLDTQEILSVELTGNDMDDVSVGKEMLQGKTEHIAEFKSDEAYDDFRFREILGKEIIQTIPPPKNAVIQKTKKDKTVPDHLVQRHEAVEYIQLHGLKQLERGIWLSSTKFK